MSETIKEISGDVSDEELCISIFNILTTAVISVAIAFTVYGVAVVIATDAIAYAAYAIAHIIAVIISTTAIVYVTYVILVYKSRGVGQ